VTTELALLPSAELVLLPGMVVPIQLDGEAQAAVDAARAAGTDRLLVVPRPDGRYATLGVIAVVDQVGRLPGGAPAAVLRGLTRARVGAGVTGPGAALWVEVTEVPEVAAPPTDEVRQLAGEYRGVVISILQQRGAWQVIDSVQSITDPSLLADAAGYAPYLSLAQKLELLETVDVETRLRRLLEWSRTHLAEQEVAERIRTDVREGMDKTQREFLLRQQMAAIRKELGEDDATADYRMRVNEADLPERVREAALREVNRLERASDQSPETGWIRTWLDTLLELPWGVRTEDNTDVHAARAVLDADHYGLNEVKDRLIEFLAVRARRAERGLHVVGGRGAGAVLALVGPPGVGKTSLGESVAAALGRRFVRVALGGVRDEAEIRGHRRTYVGAMPGRIVRAVKEAGSMNPVVLLDEVDKLGADWRGDPTSALLEVLDPAQNHTFRDHYLEVELDLSDVLFLATANVADTIPAPLLDRMEVVTLDGYTEDEKVVIGRDHLLPRQRDRAGLSADDVVVDDEALRVIAAEHTREAGVRQLERAIARVLRKVTVALASGTATPVHVGAPDLTRYLGRPRFVPETAERTAVPGVATGLAVTGTGGDVLYVEATVMDGKPGLTLTGQLGDVMKESARIALSYVLAHAEQLGIDRAALADKHIHLHVPAGAVPKDGPSAGVTMVTALTSLARQQPARSDVGMTGEVTLNGRVLPIGGVKQKLLAAHRAGLSEVFLPARNEPDLDEVPTHVRDQLNVRLVGDVSDLVTAALSANGTAPADEAHAA
jgi:ATP-dependent Lon protease